MKKIIFFNLIFLFGITLITKGQYYRNREGGFLLGINAGYTYPLGDFGKINKNGLGGNFSAKYLINRVIGLGLETGYHTFKTDIEGNDNISQDYKCSLIPFVLETTFYIPSWDRTLLPYFGLHFGGYMTHVKVKQKSYVYSEPPISEKLNLFSPGVGAHLGILIELTEYVKLDLKIKGDYVMNIKDEYNIDDYTKGNIGFDKMLNLGISVGLLYTFQ